MYPNAESPDYSPEMRVRRSYSSPKPPHKINSDARKFALTIKTATLAAARAFSISSLNLAPA
jgi:hypothetical protein